MLRLLRTLRGALHPILTLDLRSMALFRVIFGTLCIADLLSRIPYIELMYASSGWLPNVDVFSKFNAQRPHPFSFMFMLNTPEAILTFFVFSILCLTCFIIGWKTRFFQVLSALCMISLHNRNVLFQNGGDVAHNIWWMWTVFLPLGRRWSLDALIESWRTPDRSDEDLNRSRGHDDHSYVTLAAFAILLNLSFLYFLNAAHKTGPTWMSGHAVAYTLEQDRITLLLGDLIRQWVPYWGLIALSWGTLLIEGVAPLFLLSPWKTLWARRIILIILGSFHVGVGCAVQLGFFSFWMLSIYFILLQREDMDAIARWFKPRSPKITMFYDSDCGVCHAFARLCARLDRYQMITWVGRGAVVIPDGLNREAFDQLSQETLIAWNPETETYWTEHQAVAHVLKRLPLLAPVAGLLWMSGSLGRKAYQSFANRRHQVSDWLGYGVCGLILNQPESAAPVAVSAEALSGVQTFWERLKRLGGEGYIVLAIVAMLFSVVHHNQFFKPMAKPYPPQWVSAFIHYGQFIQGWRLFSPDAPVHDGWMVLEAKLSDGRVIDPRTGRAPDEQVVHYSRRYWSFYEARIDFKLKRDKRLWPAFIKWMKRPTHRLRLSPKDRVISLKYYWVGDRTQPLAQGGPRPPKSTGKKLIYQWSLQDERKKIMSSRKKVISGQNMTRSLMKKRGVMNSLKTQTPRVKKDAN
jgi:predicted DCC family thiol-disulfide oxidoreductase YuxK